MNQELRRLTVRTPLALICSGVAIAFIAMLILLVVSSLFGTSSTPGFKYAMTLTALLSFPSVVLALFFALKQSVMLRQPAWEVLLKLGLPKQRIRRFLLQENITFAVLSLVVVSLLLEPVWAVLRNTIYAPYKQHAPVWLQYSPKIIFFSAAILVVLVLIAHVFAARSVGLVKRPRKKGTSRSHTLSVIGFVMGLAAVSFLLYKVASGFNPIFGAALVGPALTLAAPAWSTYGARLIAALRARHPDSRLRLGGNVATTLRMPAVMMVTVLSIGFPMAMLCFGGMAETATRMAVVEHTVAQGRVAEVDGKSFVSDAQAENRCRELAGDCAGILRIIINEDDFELTGSEEAASLVLTPTGLRGLSGEAPSTQWPWQRYNEVMPHGAEVYGAFVVLNHDAETRGVSIKQAVYESPSQLQYGPLGTGTREFVPLLSYTIFTGVLFLFVTSLLHAQRAREILVPLEKLGMKKSEVDGAAVASMLIPVLFSTVLTVLVCVAYSVAALWYKTGTLFVTGDSVGLPTSALLVALPTLSVGTAAAAAIYARRTESP